MDDNVIFVAEADSTTYPFSSPIRRLESLYSLETAAWNDDERDHHLPDSTTSPSSSTSTTPDNLSVNFLEGYRLDNIVNWVNENIGNNQNNNVEAEDIDGGDVEPDDLEDILPPDYVQDDDDDDDFNFINFE